MTLIRTGRHYSKNAFKTFVSDSINAMTKNLGLYDNEVCACLLLGDGSLDLSLMLEWVDAIITFHIEKEYFFNNR